jgi:hypothetical protein
MQEPSSYQHTRPLHPYPLPINGGAYELSFFRYINIATATDNPEFRYRPGDPRAPEENQPASLLGCARMSQRWQMAIS